MNHDKTINSLCDRSEHMETMFKQMVSLTQSMNNSITCLGEQTRVFQLWCRDLEARIEMIEELNNKGGDNK